MLREPRGHHEFGMLIGTTSSHRVLLSHKEVAPVVEGNRGPGFGGVEFSLDLPFPAFSLMIRFNIISYVTAF